MRLQFFIARARRNREQLGVVGVLFSDDAVRKQRHDAIGGRRSENDVGRHLKNAIEIKTGAKRFAHLVDLAEDVRLALQRFKYSVATRHCRTTANARIGLAQDCGQHVLRGHQQLSVAERLVVVT